ncbi:hypothetical protein ACS25B_11800 [Dickeya dadantii subsp. dieffenbachiae]|uniref:hypothetical protein n=1 Tax=Dickeya dadantii TaxID=204038 RepID=UPI0005778B76|nr:hypothetical protein [Dickeya dadantii]
MIAALRVIKTLFLNTVMAEGQANVSLWENGARYLVCKKIKCSQLADNKKTELFKRIVEKVE